MSLQSISIVSADNGWAIGHISCKPTTLLMRYSRGQWTILPQTRWSRRYVRIYRRLNGVGARWLGLGLHAFPGSDHYHSFRPGGVLLHYDGNSWKITTHAFPLASVRSSALLMLSPTDGWATGDGITLHYDGTAWREVTTLSDRQWGGGAAIAATDPDDVWIARFGGDIVHYDGTSWSEQDIMLPIAQQALGPFLLTGIAMRSPEGGYAVGSIGNSSTG